MSDEEQELRLIEKGLDDAVATGHLEVSIKNGEKVYSITEEGKARTEAQLNHFLDVMVHQYMAAFGVPEFMAEDLLFRRAAERFGVKFE